MSTLALICDAVRAHGRFVEEQARRARSDMAFRDELLTQWNTIRKNIGTLRTPTGLELPAYPLPASDDPGEIARYLSGEGLPGEFPFVNAIYREMYRTPEPPNPKSAIRNPELEEPTRLFAGLGLAEDTNQRFHFLTKHQRSIRLSTAFDGPTLYGLDSDAGGVFGKIGEGDFMTSFHSGASASPFR
jgi:methylmalonyl-CoA mutase N-terminal domain/subunit